MNTKKIVVLDYENQKVILLKCMESEEVVEVVLSFCEESGTSFNNIHYMQVNKLEVDF
jgi:hypothetical protein